MEYGGCLIPAAIYNIPAASIQYILSTRTSAVNSNLQSLLAHHIYALARDVQMIKAYNLYEYSYRKYIWQ